MLKSRKEKILQEVLLKTSRSGGKGGQHVNKTSSKVMLIFDVQKSNVFSEEEKAILLKKLAIKLVKDKMLMVVAEGERSQLQNRTTAEKKLMEILDKALKKRKKRKATQPTKTSIEKRLKTKKIQGEKKALRKNDLN